MLPCCVPGLLIRSTYTVCKADPSRLLTGEAPDSRFYGKGRIHGSDGMCVFSLTCPVVVNANCNVVSS